MFAVFKLLECGVAPHEIESKLLRMGPVDLDLLYGALECVLDAMGSPGPSPHHAASSGRSGAGANSPSDPASPEDQPWYSRGILALAG